MRRPKFHPKSKEPFPEPPWESWRNRAISHLYRWAVISQYDDGWKIGWCVKLVHAEKLRLFMISLHG